MQTTRALVATLALGLAVWPRSLAGAQEPPERVLLEVVRCADSTFDAGLVLEHVRIELASDGIRDVRQRVDAPVDATLALALVRVEEPCQLGGPFVLHIDDLVTQKSVERQLSLVDLTVTALPRALALGIAELLRASWAELEIADVRTERPASIVDALRVRVRGLREARALADPNVTVSAEVVPLETPAIVGTADVAITASAVVRAFPGSATAPVGARVALDLPIAETWVMRIDGEALFGTSLAALGAIDIGLAGGGVTVAVIAPIGAAQLSLGARVGAAVAWARGRPSEPAIRGSAGEGFVLLLGAVAELDAPIADIVALRFGIEAGGAPVGYQARVGSTPVAGISGGAIAAWGGIALTL